MPRIFLLYIFLAVAILIPCSNCQSEISEEVSKSIWNSCVKHYSNPEKPCKILISELSEEEKVSVIYSIVFNEQFDIDSAHSVGESILLFGPIAKQPIKDILMGTFSTESELRAMIYAMGELAPEARELLPLLVPLLKHQSRWVRLNSVITISKFAGYAKNLTPDLLPLLNDSDGSVKMNTEEALFQIGNASLGPLARSMTDEGFNLEIIFEFPRRIGARSAPIVSRLCHAIPPEKFKHLSNIFYATPSWLRNSFKENASERDLACLGSIKDDEPLNLEVHISRLLSIAKGAQKTQKKVKTTGRLELEDATSLAYDDALLYASAFILGCIGDPTALSDLREISKNSPLPKFQEIAKWATEGAACEIDSALPYLTEVIEDSKKEEDENFLALLSLSDGLEKTIFFEAFVNRFIHKLTSSPDFVHNQEVRARVYKLITHIPLMGDKGLPYLEKIISIFSPYKDYEIYRAAIEESSNFGALAIPLLKQELEKSEEWPRARGIIRQLEYIGNKEAQDILDKYWDGKNFNPYENQDEIRAILDKDINTSSIGYLVSPIWTLVKSIFTHLLFVVVGLRAFLFLFRKFQRKNKLPCAK